MKEADLAGQTGMWRNDRRWDEEKWYLNYCAVWAQWLFSFLCELSSFLLLALGHRRLQCHMRSLLFWSQGRVPIILPAPVNEETRVLTSTSIDIFIPLSQRWNRHLPSFCHRRGLLIFCSDVSVNRSVVLLPLLWNVSVIDFHSVLGINHQRMKVSWLVLQLIQHRDIWWFLHPAFSCQFACVVIVCCKKEQKTRRDPLTSFFVAVFSHRCQFWLALGWMHNFPFSFCSFKHILWALTLKRHCLNRIEFRIEFTLLIPDWESRQEAERKRQKRRRHWEILPRRNKDLDKRKRQCGKNT